MTSGKLENIIKYTKNLNVLYVEDNIYVQQQTIKMLESFFNNIYIASNGKEALDLFNTENLYNLIITDIEMPFVDGVSLIEIIREYNKKVPIIVLSAHDNKDYFLKTINAGIDGYILKPYTLEQISQTLEYIIEKYDLEEIFDNLIKLEFNYFLYILFFDKIIIYINILLLNNQMLKELLLHLLQLLLLFVFVL